MPEEKKRKPLNRYQRFLRKNKGALRCEWCGRWTPVEPHQVKHGKPWKETTDKEWKDIFESKNPTFRCRREKCLHTRG